MGNPIVYAPDDHFEKPISRQDDLCGQAVHSGPEILWVARESQPAANQEDPMVMDEDDDDDPVPDLLSDSDFEEFSDRIDEDQEEADEADEEAPQPLLQGQARRAELARHLRYFRALQAQNHSLVDILAPFQASLPLREPEPAQASMSAPQLPFRCEAGMLDLRAEGQVLPEAALRAPALVVNPPQPPASAPLPQRRTRRVQLVPYMPSNPPRHSSRHAPAGTSTGGEEVARRSDITITIAGIAADAAGSWSLLGAVHDDGPAATRHPAIGPPRPQQRERAGVRRELVRRQWDRTQQ